MWNWVIVLKQEHFREMQKNPGRRKEKEWKKMDSGEFPQRNYLIFE